VQAASDVLFGNASGDALSEEAAKGKIIRLQDWLGPSVCPIDVSVPEDLNDNDD
jgi:hypothetical protein